MRRSIARATVALLGFSLVACSDDNVTAPSSTPVPSVASVRTVKVSDDIVTLTVGQQLHIEAPPGSKWSVDDPGIAQVFGDGDIRAVGVGTTTITVSGDGTASDVLVTVMPVADEEVPAGTHAQADQ